MYDSCTIQVLYMYDTCTIHALYMYDTSTIHVQYMYDSCTIHVRYMYDTCTIHVRFMYDTWTIHVQYMYDTWTIHVRYMDDTCTIHVRYIYQKVYNFFCIIKYKYHKFHFLSMLHKSNRKTRITQSLCSYNGFQGIVVNRFCSFQMKGHLESIVLLLI